MPKDLIEKHGAVSREVAAALAEGAYHKSKADIAISTTGIAGPDTSDHKPVGLVYIGVCYNGSTRVIELHLSGNRKQIQTETVGHAFDLLLSVIEDQLY